LFAFFWACFVRFVGLSPRFAPAAFSLPFASPSAAATAMRIADHFTTELVKGVEKRRCKYCPLSYSLRSGHGTLHDHMKSKHSHKLANDASQPAAAAAAAAAASGHGHASDADECSSITAAAPYAGGAAAASAPFSPAPSAGSKRSSSAVSSLLESQPKGAKQQTLLSAFSSSANSSLVQQTALFFATNHIAYNVADSASFRSFCAALRGSTAAVPGRRAVKNAVADLAESTRSAVVQRITGQTAPVTVAIDGWTNVRHTKVTNLLLLCSGVAYYWCSIPNTYAANTAEWLASALTPRLEGIVELGIRFVALVADNEAVNGALFDRLVTPFPFLIRIPCAAHTIQLVVRQIMALTKFRRTLEGMQSILSSFERQKAERMRLRTLQQSAGAAHEYVLVKPNDTRWNSQLYAAQRLIKLRAYVDLIFPQDDGFWGDLAALVSFLLPFQAATDAIQRDSATLFHVFEQFTMLLNHISSSSAQNGASVTQRATAALKRRWNSQVNQPATVACALLSLDSNLSELSEAVLDEAKRFIVVFGASYLRFYQLTAEEDGDALEGELVHQLGSFIGRRDRFHAMDALIAGAKARCASRNVPFNPLDIWDMHSIELSRVAKALLSVTASEASVERSFSAQDSIHTKKRNRLLDDSVQREMFVKFNTRALNREQHWQLHSATIDLSPDVEFFAAPPSDDEVSEADSVASNQSADEQAEGEPAAAAAAARPVRSASALGEEMRSFLTEYIDQHGITLANCRRWGSDRRNALDHALLNGPTGGFTTEDAIALIRDILDEQNDS